MCAVAILFEPDGVDGPIYCFVKYYLPDEAPLVVDDGLGHMIAGWVQDGHLKLTPGTMADFDEIESDIRDLAMAFDVQMIGFDPFQSNDIANRLFDDGMGLPVCQLHNSARNLSVPTDDILSRLPGKKFRHDGNPIFAWNAVNVEGQRKGNGLILPRRDKGQVHKKIDGFVAAVMANALRLTPDAARTREGKKLPRSAYDSDNVIGLNDD